MSSILYLDDATFDEQVKASEKPVVVDFWADWCGPCKMIAPILEEIADSHDSIQVAKLDIDANPDIARRYSVMSIPTLVVFVDGKESKRIVGAKPKGALLSELSEFVS